MTGPTLAEIAHHEVLALHRFFVAWFRDASGTVDFSALERSLAADFSMVTPDGRAHDRAAVIERVHRARGSAPAGFGIAVVDAHPVWQADAAILLHYVERQHGAGPTTVRRSCALITREPAAPRGAVWRHLQETWMAEEKSV